MFFLLRYPSGGQILTSSGHWIELASLDVNFERLQEVAQKNFSSSYYNEMQSDIQSASTQQERKQKVQTWANKMVS